ncbi:MAG: RsmB/NOP family class I SAM-dependent RNA methyltransferase [Promethearchaeota archaeon]
MSEIEYGLSARLALKKVFSKYRITDWKLRSKVHALIIETIRRLNYIDWIINISLKGSSISRLYPYIRSISRLAVYHLKFQSTRPSQFFTVSVGLIAKKFGNKHARFMKALLHEIERKDITAYFMRQSESERIGLQLFHPTWFVRYLFRLIGRSEALKLMKTNILPPPRYIRVNTLKIDPDMLQRELSKEQIIASTDPDLFDVMCIQKTRKPLIHSLCYKKGYFYIQNKASALVTHVLNPQKEDFILDTCAAPGGKTTHIGQFMQNKGVIIALDSSSKRMRELLETSRRQSIEIIQPLLIDSRSASFIPEKQFDKVLIDAPCSSTGAFWSRPSRKWTVNKRLIKWLQQIQWSLLERAARQVRLKGILVYATCSLTLEENEMIIERFLKLNPEFQLVKATPFIGVQGFRGLSRCQRLFPHTNRTDGSFIAKMLRRS